MRKPIIYIDMDNTICDFKAMHNKEFHPETNPYPQSRVGFFRELEEIQNSTEIIKKLKDIGYEIYFLSRPSIYNLHSYTEKAEYIKEHFGFEWLDKLILCCDKSLLMGNFLIDDSEADGQLGFKGLFMQFNRDIDEFRGIPFTEWDEIYDYLKNFTNFFNTIKSW